MHHGTDLSTTRIFYTERMVSVIGRTPVEACTNLPCIGDGQGSPVENGWMGCRSPTIGIEDDGRDWWPGGGVRGRGGGLAASPDG